MHGTTHLYSGQEAWPVGVCSVLGRRAIASPAPTAATATRSRSASSPQALMDELLGRATGRVRRARRLDERHRPRAPADGLLRDRRRQHRRGHGRGARAPAPRRRRGRASSATAPPTRATSHECLNFAKVRDAPVVFVCENNLYGEFTPFETRHGGGDPRPRRERSASRRRPSTATTSGRCAPPRPHAVRRAARGRRPAFVESLTYRYRRALAQRSGQVPQARRARRVEAARPAARRARWARRALWHARARRSTASIPRSRTSIGSRRRGRERPRRSRTPSAPVTEFKHARPAEARREPRLSESDFRTAICEALDEELARDESVIFFGEDVAVRRRRLRHHGRPRRHGTAPTASSTPRSPSSRWPARPTAAPSAACGRSSRSCSATSCR